MDVQDLPLVLAISGTTECEHFEEGFVQQAANDVLRALSDFFDGDIELNVYTAPWEAEDMPLGQLTLRVGREDRCADIGIVFGHPKGPVRQSFDSDAFEKDPANPHSGGIFVASFDECWALTCRVLEGLGPREVCFSFGA